MASVVNGLLINPGHLYLAGTGLRYMSAIEKIEVELSVVIGEATMPLRRALQLGRGAVVNLGGDANRPLTVKANGRAIAEGRVVLDGDDVKLQLSGAKPA